MTTKLSIFCIVVFLLFASIATTTTGTTTTTTSDGGSSTVENDLRPESVGSQTGTTDFVNQDEEQQVAQLRDAIGKGQKFQFQAEINQLLAIIINSLYTNKEIFLRELISNASDAIDKIRYISLTNRTALESNEKLEIRIRANRLLNTLTIRDTGIGMTSKDLADNLGTIARSGTKAFIEKLKEAAKKDSDSSGSSGGSSMSLIGQFGVGFYSAFLVADKVVVVSKHNDDKQQIWESQADSSFVIAEDPRGNTLGRGTEITLHLKDDAKAYLDTEDTLKTVIHKYSEFIQYPIYLYTTVNVTVNVTKEEEKPTTAAPSSDEQTTTAPASTEEQTTAAPSSEQTTAAPASTEAKPEVEVKEEETGAKSDESKPSEPSTRVESRDVWHLMNANKPTWVRDPKTVTQEEYTSFYKGISKDIEGPLTYTHFKSEGASVDFRSLLFVPSIAPHNMFDFVQKQSNIRLYVKRVFITDAINDLIPRYLNFIRGVVDSDDLPLNISREILQHSHLLRMIKRKLVQKILAMFRQLSDRQVKQEDDEKKGTAETSQPTPGKRESDGIFKYNRFWKEYGKNIKLGVIEDPENRDRLLKLVRFYSTKSEFFQASLDDYITRMKNFTTSSGKVKKQKYIYFITGDNMDELRKSPFLEEFRNRDLEVLYMSDSVDEYMTQTVKEYQGKELMSITREGLKLDDDSDDSDEEERKKKEEQLKKDFEPLSTMFKDILGQRVIRADVGHRFTSADQSPIVVAATKHGYTANLVRIMKAQTLGSTEQQYLDLFANAKVIEFNTHHPVVRELNRRARMDKDDKFTRSVAELLWETAQMRSGYGIDDGALFADRIVDLMRSGLRVDEPEAQPQPKAQPSSPKDEL